MQGKDVTADMRLLHPTSGQRRSPMPSSGAANEGRRWGSRSPGPGRRRSATACNGSRTG